MPKRDDEGGGPRPAVKLDYRVLAHWREDGRHCAEIVWTGGGPEGELAIQASREAWAEFHHAAAHVPLGAEDFTVDLMEERLRFVATEKGPGFYQRDGQTKQIGCSNAPDGMVDTRPLRTISRADIAGLQSLAKTRRLDSRVADPCTTCGSISRELRYSPDGLPYCPGHLPSEPS